MKAALASRKTTIAAAASAVFLTVAALLAFLAYQGQPAHAQASPTVEVSLSPAGPVEPGTTIAVTMKFHNLEYDPDTTTTDYAFRADVKDAQGNDADACEDNAGGYGMGVDRYINKVDEDPEVRSARTTGDCLPGDYTIKARLKNASGDTVMATATVQLTILAPPLATASSTNGASMSESDANATFTVTLDRNAPRDVTVYFTVSQDGDFISGAPPTSVIVRDGQSSAQVNVALDDDAADELDGSLTFTIDASGDDAYRAGTPASATVTVTDDDAPPPTLTVTAPDTVTAGQSASVTGLINNLPAGRYTVRIVVLHAGDGSDVTQGTASLTVESETPTLPEKDTWGRYPIKPGNPAATMAGSTGIFTWQALAVQPDQYQIYRFEHDCRNSCRKFWQVPATQTSFRDEYMQAGTKYTYGVQGIYPSGPTHYAQAVITAPDPAAGAPASPTGLTASHDSAAGAINLSWTAPSPATGVTGYRIHRCGWTNRNDVECADFLTGSTSTTHADTDVTSGKAYTYRIRAVGASGDSYIAGYARVTVP